MIKTKCAIVLLATTALALAVDASTDLAPPDDIPLIECGDIREEKWHQF